VIISMAPGEVGVPSGKLPVAGWLLFAADFLSTQLLLPLVRLPMRSFGLTGAGSINCSSV